MPSNNTKKLLHACKHSTTSKLRVEQIDSIFDNQLTQEERNKIDLIALDYSRILTEVAKLVDAAYTGMDSSARGSLFDKVKKRPITEKNQAIIRNYVRVTFADNATKISAKILQYYDKYATPEERVNPQFSYPTEYVTPQGKVPMSEADVSMSIIITAYLNIINNFYMMCPCTPGNKQETKYRLEVCASMPDYITKNLDKVMADYFSKIFNRGVPEITTMMIQDFKKHIVEAAPTDNYVGMHKFN